MVKEFVILTWMMKRSTTMNKIKCKVCDCGFVPESDKHYVSRDCGKVGFAASFQANDEEELYDTFDCPQCGCQIVVQKRKRVYSAPAIDNVCDDVEEEEDDGK